MSENQLLPSDNELPEDSLDCQLEDFDFDFDDDFEEEAEEDWQTEPEPEFMAQWHFPPESGER